MSLETIEKEMEYFFQQPELTPAAEIAYSGYAVQGVCTDGTYLYMAFILSGGNNIANTKLVKLKIADWSVVKVVEDYCYNHANDMAYVEEPTGNYLYILHSDSPSEYRNKISKVSADTLEFIESFTISDNVLTVTYLPTYKVFACTLCASRIIVVYDANWIEIKRIVPDNIQFYMSGPQSIDCDKNFIYVNSTSVTNPAYNHMFVTDWNGKSIIRYGMFSLNEPQAFLKCNDKFVVVDKIKEGGIWKAKIYLTKLDVDSWAKGATLKEARNSMPGTWYTLYKPNGGTKLVTGNTITLPSWCDINNFQRIEFDVYFSGHQSYTWYKSGNVNIRSVNMTDSLSVYDIVINELTMSYDSINKKFTIITNNRLLVKMDGLSKEIVSLSKVSADTLDNCKIYGIYGIS